MRDKEKVTLAEALKQNTRDPQEPPEKKEGRVPPEKVPEKLSASRRGKRNISGYFAPEVHRQLRIIAAEEDKPLQEILGDALNALFVNKGRPPIA